MTAQIFGASLGYDAFLVAFKIPNFLRRLFAEGAFIQAFVPILSEYQTRQTEQETKKLLQDTLGSLAVILLLLTGCVEFFADHWIRLLAPGFAGTERLVLATQMLHITFPYLFFISMAAFGSAILNTYGVYAPPAMTPILLNLAMIGAAYFLVPLVHPPIYALAIGVLIGGVLQMVFQIPFLCWKDLWTWPRIGFGNPGVKRILKRMAPALFGVSVSQVSLLLDTVFASFLPVGSFGWLYYADRLMEFPLGIFGVALSTVILPHLSRDYASGAWGAYQKTLRWGLKMVFLIAIPATLSLMCLATPMVATVFHYGAFERPDVEQAALALFAFALCLVPVILAKIFAAAFYAQHNLKTPVYSGVLTVAFNILVSAIGIFVLDLKHVALAWALSLSEVVHAVYLGVCLLKTKKMSLGQDTLIFLLKVMLALCPMAWVFMQGSIWFEEHLEATLWMRWAALMCILLLGALVYAVGLMILGVRVKDLKEDGVP